MSTVWTLWWNQSRRRRPDKEPGTRVLHEYRERPVRIARDEESDLEWQESTCKYSYALLEIVTPENTGCNVG